MAGFTTESEVPSELKTKLKAFDAALNDVEGKFTPLLNIPQTELSDQIPTLDKAKLDLVAAYSINSLFWMYLNVCGVNPKDHGLKEELERIRGYMNRVKEVQDKLNAPSVDVKAAKRFVKSALWEAAHKGEQPEQADNTSGAGAESTGGNKAQERQLYQVKGKSEKQTSQGVEASGTSDSREGRNGQGKKRKGSHHKGKGDKRKSGRYMDNR